MFSIAILGMALAALTSLAQPDAAPARINAAPSDPITITITPAVDTATVGDVRLFTAAATDALGNPAPVAGVTWQVSPTLGSLQSSGPFTAQVQMGNQPALYTNAIVASANDATPGTASVFLDAGPPASVVVSPASATLAINATQAFTAAVFDRFGNLLNLPVTWVPLDGATTLDSATGNTAVLRAGAKAGTFAEGLRAVQSGAETGVTITIPAGPPAGLTLSASPSAIRSDGQDSSVIPAQVVDAHGNETGAGAQINLSVDSCAGVCSLLPGSGVADAQGRFAATLRNTNTSPTQTLNVQIKVSGTMQAGAATAGDFDHCDWQLCAGAVVPGHPFPRLPDQQPHLLHSAADRAAGDCDSAAGAGVQPVSLHGLECFIYCGTEQLCQHWPVACVSHQH